MDECKHSSISLERWYDPFHGSEGIFGWEITCKDCGRSYTLFGKPPCGDEVQGLLNRRGQDSEPVKKGFLSGLIRLLRGKDE